MALASAFLFSEVGRSAAHRLEAPLGAGAGGGDDGGGSLGGRNRRLGGEGALDLVEAEDGRVDTDHRRDNLQQRGRERGAVTQSFPAAFRGCLRGRNFLCESQEALEQKKRAICIAQSLKSLCA